MHEKVMTIYYKAPHAEKKHIATKANLKPVQVTFKKTPQFAGALIIQRLWCFRLQP